MRPFVSRHTALAAALLAGACADRPWADYWSELPNAWRNVGTIEPTLHGDMTAVTMGSRGYRYGSAKGWVAISQVTTRPNLLPGELIEVHWVAAPDAVAGVVYGTASGSQVLLSFNRYAFRQAVHTELLLVDQSGNAVIALPTIARAFDIDNEKWTVLGGGAELLRCVAAEADMLARNELRLLAKDVSSGRLDHHEAETLQELLAPLLANDYSVCE